MLLSPVKLRKLGTEVIVLLARERLGENISRLFFCGYILHSHGAGLNFIANKETIAITCFILVYRTEFLATQMVDLLSQ